jgi:hypothetical protein
VINTFAVCVDGNYKIVLLIMNAEVTDLERGIHDCFEFAVLESS